MLFEIDALTFTLSWSLMNFVLLHWKSVGGSLNELPLIITVLVQRSVRMIHLCLDLHSKYHFSEQMRIKAVSSSLGFGDVSVWCFGCLIKDYFNSFQIW